MTASVPMPDHSEQGSPSEDAMGEVSAVLLNLEHTIARAKKGLIKVRRAGGDANVELALESAITDLTKQHKRLMQDTYYAGDAIRLL
ncbi:hypothetical protein [Demequina sp.]|uniref:hypothetical protein n=1 Tax=Demequina sp. TaxID=2050685 RepID=UPI0025BD950E|nr:hypothetical protein [Demequina sp.]